MEATNVIPGDVHPSWGGESDLGAQSMVVKHDRHGGSGALGSHLINIRDTMPPPVVDRTFGNDQTAGTTNGITPGIITKNLG